MAVKILSSEQMIHSMKPTLKEMLSLNVINDNINSKGETAKQKWLLGASLAVAVAVVVLG